MIKSMTAYSRASASSSLGRFVMEIHSVNRKMLDMSIYLPKDLLWFDIEVRKTLGQALERGQVTLRLTLQSEGVVVKDLSSYAIQLKNLKEGWEKISSELGFDAKEEVNLSFLVTQLQMVPVAVSKEEEVIIETLLHQLVSTALQDLMQMKETEGKALSFDIQKRLKIIEENLAALEVKKEKPFIHYRQKLIDKLKELGSLNIEAEERISRELVLLADKMDVTEELVRLRAHIEHFHHHLSSEKKTIGRTLDFLTQEMHREINTLGSKSSDSEISLCVVKCKSELDKIREQVQNIE